MTLRTVGNGLVWPGYSPPHRVRDPKPTSHRPRFPPTVVKTGAFFGTIPATPTAWDDRYEDLREDWLRGRMTGEVGLVLHQGLLAWVRAAPRAVAAPTAESCQTSAPTLATHSLVFAFVELILNRRPEGPS